MKFEIKRVTNGLILTAEYGSDLPEENITLVYQEPSISLEENEAEAFADFLRLINDNFGPMTSRYSKARIYVTVEPGDKYETSTPPEDTL